MLSGWLGTVGAAKETWLAGHVLDADAGAETLVPKSIWLCNAIGS